MPGTLCVRTSPQCCFAARKPDLPGWRRDDVGTVDGSGTRCNSSELVSAARLFDLAIDNLITTMNKATDHGSVASFKGLQWCMRLESDTASAIDPGISGTLAGPLEVPVHVYIRIMQRRSELAAAMNKRLFCLDVLALPTTRTTAPLAEPLILDPELADRTERHLLRNTQISSA
jgi:aspartyl-tRNA(Asn)/glutamyl-tRNA(Gln) amidotransferase subunit A